MSKDRNYTTRGGQIFFHNLRMFFQIQGWVIKWGLTIALLLTCVITYIICPYDEVIKAAYYVKFYVLSLIFYNAPYTLSTMDYKGVVYTNTIEAFVNNGSLHHSFKLVLFDVQLAFLIGLIAALVVISLVLKIFNKKGESQTKDKFIRGTEIATPKKLSKELKRRKMRSSLSIDNLYFFKRNFEVQHLLIEGTTGTGKSVLLRKILKWIRDRGDRAIVYDKGCTFVGKMYDPQKDILLNPFDERTAYWDVWMDADSPSDFENIATALIPEKGDADPFWVLAARTIFSSTAYKMSLEDKENRTTKRFLELMLTSELEDLSGYLKGSESSSLVSDKAAKIAISIKSILAAYIKSLRFLEKLDEPDSTGKPRQRFSIREWVQDDDHEGFLFMSSNARQHVSLRPLISAWLSTASTAILGMDPNPERRIWVVMDEMPTLHKLPELSETLSEVRKFGGCYIIGMQSYAQLLKNYGRHTADEIFDLLNTRFFFRSPSEQMARVTSADLGEQEFEETSEQYSYGAAQVRDGVSLGRKRTKRPAVSSTEIMQLDDLEFWLRSSGKFPIIKHKMKYDEMNDINAPFVPRTMPSTERGQRLDAMIAWNQVSALQKIDKQDRETLFGVYQSDMEEDHQSTQRSKLDKLKRDSRQYDPAEQKRIDESEQHKDDPLDDLRRIDNEPAASHDVDIAF